MIRRLAFLISFFSFLSTICEAQQEGPPAITPIEKAEPDATPKTNPPTEKPNKQVEKKPAAPQKYVVQKGDNPWVIAKNHGIDLPALLKANEINDPKSLKIGDVLLLPEGVASKNPPKVDPKTLEPAKPMVAKPVSKESESGDDWETYTIKSGDNPWTVAKQLKVDHQKIIQLNEGLDFTKLAIGQKIKVPKKP